MSATEDQIGKGEEASKPKEKATPAPSSKAQDEREVLKDELRGFQLGKDARDALQKELGDEEAQKKRETVFRTLLKPFGVFGMILGKFASPITRIFSSKKEIPQEEFEQILAETTDKTQDEMNLSESIFAHRINTPEEINEQIENGERQIEVDLRLGKDGEIYAVHDTIAEEENPAGKYPKLEDVLKAFASNKQQRVSIYFDIKDVGVLDKLDTAIAKADGEFGHVEGYVPLGERHFIGAFNHEILAKAKERDPNRPTILTYIPAAELKSVSAMMKLMGHQKLGNVAKEIDRLAGTSLEKEMDNLQIHVDGKAVKGHEEGAQNIVNVYNLLPPDDVLKNVDIIAVPSPLATKKLIDRAHEKGVKVGLWGGEQRDIQNALALGADIVVSDTPEYLRTDIASSDKVIELDSRRETENSDEEDGPEAATQQDKAA